MRRGGGGAADLKEDLNFTNNNSSVEIVNVFAI